MSGQVQRIEYVLRTRMGIAPSRGFQLNSRSFPLFIHYQFEQYLSLSSYSASYYLIRLDTNLGAAAEWKNVTSTAYESAYSAVL